MSSNRINNNKTFNNHQKIWYSSNKKYQEGSVMDFQKIDGATYTTYKLTQKDIGSALKDLWHIRPPSGNNCSGCHR